VCYMYDHLSRTCHESSGNDPETLVRRRRIGIVVNGGLRCLGSGLRLKSKFGNGIHLVVGLTTRKSRVRAPKAVQLAALAAQQVTDCAFACSVRRAVSLQIAVPRCAP
jgi:hypothetical protein